MMMMRWWSTASSEREMARETKTQFGLRIVFEFTMWTLLVTISLLLASHFWHQSGQDQKSLIIKRLNVVLRNKSHRTIDLPAAIQHRSSLLYYFEYRIAISSRHLCVVVPNRVIRYILQFCSSIVKYIASSQRVCVCGVCAMCVCLCT